MDVASFQHPNQAAINCPQSGLCLADPGNATANGTGLPMATCASATGQAWRAQ